MSIINSKGEIIAQEKAQQDDIKKVEKHHYALMGEIHFAAEDEMVANAKLMELQDAFTNDPNIEVLPQTKVNMVKVNKTPLVKLDDKIIT